MVFSFQLYLRTVLADQDVARVIAAFDEVVDKKENTLIDAATVANITGVTMDILRKTAMLVLETGVRACVCVCVCYC